MANMAVQHEEKWAKRIALGSSERQTEWGKKKNKKMKKMANLSHQTKQKLYNKADKGGKQHKF